MGITEVRRALELMRYHIDSEHLRETFHKLDHDRTGFLDFAGFLRLMRMVEDDIVFIAAGESRGLEVMESPTAKALGNVRGAESVTLSLHQRPKSTRASTHFGAASAPARTQQGVRQTQVQFRDEIDS